ncbi:HIT-like protein, partial [Trichocladium antarcticum]
MRAVPSASQQQPAQPTAIYFGPFEVTNQVFLTTPHSFALVNLKPLLPGHVLVCPLRPHRRLTDLTTPELTDLFTTVQRVQRMLAVHYFHHSHQQHDENDDDDENDRGAFNIALQDGPLAGQTVPHVHVHVIPRIKGSTAKPASTPSDALYEHMADEEGNVGGALWDAAAAAAAAAAAGLMRERPRPGGRFPSIEDAARRARSMGEMEEEAG